MTRHGVEEVAAVDDACSLPTADRPLRLAELEDLFATAVRAVDRLEPARLRLALEVAVPAGRSAVLDSLAARATAAAGVRA
jgi:hypothetical protein